jgi:hypothetical protein
MSSTIRASIHVSPDCYTDVRVDKLKTDDKKYAVLTLDNLTIFISDHGKALEIASLLVSAAQELEDEDEKFKKS